MDIESLRACCLSFPNATESLQWGDNLCFKVMGKIFCIAALDIDSRPRLGFKCVPEIFGELIEREGIAPAPYLGRYKWVGLETLDTLPLRELKDLIAKSYELVVAKLPKKPTRKRTASKRKLPPRQRFARSH